MDKPIGRSISILYRQSQIYFNYILKEFDITSAEYPLILYLYERDGITQDDLSTYLYIDKSAVTRAIKTLEEKGYVKREKDHRDKRFNRVYLSKKARLLDEEIKKRIFSWNELLTEGLDDETVNIVIRALGTMVSKVECSDFKREME